MSHSSTTSKLASIVAIAGLAAACGEAAGPYHRSLDLPRLQHVAAGSGITLNQLNGALGQGGQLLIKGFNPTNPHRGDAIVATFYWTGATTPENIVDSVTDVITDINFTPVGNSYSLVEYVHRDGFSMATYVAINVQNFPDPNTDPGQGDILAVRAHLAEPVVDGGVTLTSWTGVNSVAAYAVGEHRSASGTAADIVAVGPGAIRIGAGALAYAVTMSNGIYGRDPPAGFTRITTGSDALMVNELDYAIQAAVDTIDPQWTWFFGSESAWLATVIALNPPLHLGFSVQPRTTLPLMPITPAVQVEVLNALGNRVTDVTGQVTIAIGRNAGRLLPGTLSGTTTVSLVNGVATFSNLSIDQLGDGYTLVATLSNVFSAESAPFNIGAF